MLKKLILLCGLVLAASFGLQAKTKAEKAGWKIGMQSYTFHMFSLQEALDKCQELGVKYIEVYPGHKLGEGYGDLAFGPDLDAATLKVPVSIPRTTWRTGHASSRWPRL